MITLSLLLLASPLLLIANTEATAAEACSTFEKKLKREQFIIVEREKELSQKIKKGHDKFEQAELNRLIERHHASIERFNQKLEGFNKKCIKKVVSKRKTAKLKKQTKQNRKNQQSKTNPEADVQASRMLIKTLKGYFIQAGAFKRYTNATNLQTRLTKEKIDSLILTRPYVYALWVGPYQNRQTASVAKATLLKNYKIDGYIIHFK